MLWVLQRRWRLVGAMETTKAKWNAEGLEVERRTS